MLGKARAALRTGQLGRFSSHRHRNQIIRNHISRSYVTIMGLDYGTTNSCVALLEGGKPRVIENLEGERISASVVAVNEDGSKIVGTPARRQGISNPHNTFFAIKRLLGRRFDDPHVKEMAQSVPFKIVQGQDKTAWVEDAFGKKHSAVSLAGDVILKMKADAESFLGRNIDKVILSTPRHFTEPHHRALQSAVEYAGLKVHKLVPEPIAAAVGYGLSTQDDQTILVYHLGGGTFDVSILELKDGVFEVKASKGDLNLGGQEFDNRIAEGLIKQFQEESKMDLMTDLPAIQRARIRDAAERAKLECSSSVRSAVTLNYLMADASGPKHLNAVLGRAKLEEMAQDIIQKTMDITAECVQEAGLTMADITTVLAVGGMTKMPKIRESLMALTEKEPLKGINPDEAVAYGCAMQGEVQVETYDKVEITDTLALSIGVEVAGGVYVKMIPAGTTSPCRRTMRFSTHSDNQKKVEIKVYQGERALAKDNVHVTTAVIDNLPPMPKGFPQIELTIEIDAVGTIYVMTKELLTDKQDIHYKYFGKFVKWGGVTAAEAKKMTKEADKFKEADKKARAITEARVKGLDAVIELEKELASLGEFISEPDAEVIRGKIVDIKSFLDQNAPIDQILQAIGEADEICSPIIHEAVKRYRQPKPAEQAQ